MLRTAIIGCGLMGQKRAKSLPDSQLVACADVDPERARAMAEYFPGIACSTDWREALKPAEIIIVCTPHHLLAEITLAAIRSGKHVLVEKPAARSTSEMETLIAEANNSSQLVRVGLNHRYHPAMMKARNLVESGAVGELMYVRGRYGHGGRLQYEKEWRANRELSGGGELLDQGIHLIDLSRWFLGEFRDVGGFTNCYFWDTEVEDNAFLTLRTEQNQVAFLHVSWTEWKNLFSFEIFGKHGKLEITGLGGSYGTEKLLYYRMLPEMGPPEITSWEFPGEDPSLETEYRDFLTDIELRRKPSVGLEDAYAALKIIETIYKL